MPATGACEDLLTPIAKAWCTDLGVEVASLGVQVHGGMGFVEEGGAAQFYRDARIAPIYEGTNGIQAIDLYGRKLLGDRGEAMRRLIDEAAQAVDEFADSAPARLSVAADRARSATRLHAGAPRATTRWRALTPIWRWPATSPAACFWQEACARARALGHDQVTPGRANRTAWVLCRDRAGAR